MKVLTPHSLYGLEDMNHSNNHAARLQELDEQTLVVQKRIERIKKDQEQVGGMTDKIAADIGAIVAVVTGAVSSLMLARDLFNHYDPRSPELNDKIYKLTKRFHAEGEKLKTLRENGASKATLDQAEKKVADLRAEIQRLNKADVPLRKDFMDRIRGGRMNWKTVGQATLLIGSIIVFVTIVLRWINRHLTAVHNAILRRRKQSIS